MATQPPPRRPSAGRRLEEPSPGAFAARRAVGVASLPAFMTPPR